MIEININDYVTVELTAKGAAVYNACWNDKAYRYPGFVEKHLKEGDTYRDSLWSVMRIFGKHCGLGLDVPFTQCKMTILESCS